jgi:diadenylate cyclase
VAEVTDEELRGVLADLAPGTVIRDGIERIIGAGRGALIVLADTESVRDVCSGGFVIDANLTAQRIAELAKMDGAVIVDMESEHIYRANVHLVPDASISTNETGTRHRSAERVARQTGTPVLSVSESMSRVTLYYGERKRVLEDVSSLLFRANQALSTLERYRTRLNEVTNRLGERELEDDVTLRDVCTTLQRSEMVRRIEREVGDHVAELGREGRLIELQRAELMSEVEEERVLVVEDYRGDRRRKLRSVLDDLDELSSHDLLDLDAIDCWPASPVCRRRSSTSWSRGSGRCRGSSTPARRNCWRSRGSVTPGPAASRRACASWPRRPAGTADAITGRWCARTVQAPLRCAHPADLR